MLSRHSLIGASPAVTTVHTGLLMLSHIQPLFEPQPARPLRAVEQLSLPTRLPVPLIPTTPEMPVVSSSPAVIPPQTSRLTPIRPESQPLANTRHECFAQLVAEGDPAGVAYVKVYRTSAQCGSASASRLLRNVNVRERISGLQKEAAKGTVLTLAHKREILHDIVTTPLSDVNEYSPLCQY